MTAIRLVDHLAGRAADQLAEILAESFPPEECDDPADLIDNVNAGRRQLYAALDGDTLVGFGLLLALLGADAVLLEYLAVGEGSRNRGVGADVLARIVEDSDAAGMLIEVDPPDAAEGPEREIRRRRIGFYERTGASLVAGARSYRVPLADRTLPYLLMWRPIREPGGLAGDRLRQVVTATLVQCYTLRPDTALHRENLAALNG